jgi:hypothetical protein
VIVEVELPRAPARVGEHIHRGTVPRLEADVAGGCLRHHGHAIDSHAVMAVADDVEIDRPSHRRRIHLLAA